MMHDGFIVVAGQPALNHSLIQTPIKRWEARLDLDFSVSSGRSYLAKNVMLALWSYKNLAS